MRFAARAGPRPVTCSSGLRTARPKSSASTARRLDGAISFRRPRCRTRRRSAQPMTAAISRKFLRARSRSPITTDSISGARTPSGAGGYAGSAWPATSSPQGSRRRVLPARWALVSASMRRHRFGSSPTAPCGRCSEPTSTANGAHLCEVEIDPDTGRTEIVAFWAVDDIGTVINPMIVEAQIHGGLAQGIGQALLERCAYDGGGQPICGSFMDYAIVRADDVPSFGTECDESQPCTHNPLGAKGCGESGAIGAPAAVIGAALDALAPLGVTDLDMPLTSEQVWRRIQQAQQTSRTAAAATADA